MHLQLYQLPSKVWRLVVWPGDGADPTEVIEFLEYRNVRWAAKQRGWKTPTERQLEKSCVTGEKTGNWQYYEDGTFEDSSSHYWECPLVATRLCHSCEHNPHIAECPYVEFLGAEVLR